MLLPLHRRRVSTAKPTDTPLRRRLIETHQLPRSGCSGGSAAVDIYFAFYLILQPPSASECMQSLAQTTHFFLVSSVHARGREVSKSYQSAINRKETSYQEFVPRCA